MSGPIAYYQIRWRDNTSDGEYTYGRLDPPATEFKITGVQPTKSYTIEARSVGPSGLKSIWVDISHTVADNQTPDSPSDPVVASMPNAIQITWTWGRVQTGDVEVVVEQSPTGLTGTWIEVGRTKASGIVIDQTLPDLFYFRLYAVNYQGKTSAISSTLSGRAYIVNLPTKNLVIDGSGHVEVDCFYKNFYLYLNANVTQVNFINQSYADTALIQVENGAGTHTFEFGSGKTPISGAPYVPSNYPGAVDVLGCHTVDYGATWKIAYQKPDGTTSGGTALVVVITPSPASGSSDSSGGSATAPSVGVTATLTGGTGTGRTYLWERVDGGGTTNFNISSTTVANPTFSIASGTGSFDETQVWRCRGSDDSTLYDDETVSVHLTRTGYSGGGGGGSALYLTADTTNINESVFTPAGEAEPVIGTVYITVHNAVGAISWTAELVSGSIKAPTQLSTVGATTGWQWRYNGWSNIEYDAVYRFHVTDSLGNTNTIDITVHLERSNDL
jgi:hypothetical protein